MPSIVSLGVMVDQDGGIVCAGGFIIQLMPGADEAVINYLEEKIKLAPSVTKILANRKRHLKIYCSGYLAIRI